jgi:hypothetical protein
MSYLYSSTSFRTTQDTQLKTALEPTRPSYFKSAVSAFTAIAYTEADKATFRSNRRWIEITAARYSDLQPIGGGE